MGIQVHRTQENTRQYPLHRHDAWEIILYVKGSGVLRTTRDAIPFHPGTIILIPPQIAHGSAAEHCFENFSVVGPFQNQFLFDAPVCLQDNREQDGRVLAKMLYKNRMASEPFLQSLAQAYANYVLSLVSLETPIGSVVHEIIQRISEQAVSPDFDLRALLNSYNYSLDYLRQQFRQVTGMHPVRFLTKCRMEKAQFFIEVYGNTLPLTEIAERCGYTDYIYFSKCFRAFTGLSPREYKASKQK